MIEVQLNFKTEGGGGAGGGGGGGGEVVGALIGAVEFDMAFKDLYSRLGGGHFTLKHLTSPHAGQPGFP